MIQRFYGNMSWWNTAEDPDDVPGDIRKAKELYLSDKKSNLEEVIALLEPYIKGQFMLDEFDESSKFFDPEYCTVDSSFIKLTGVDFEEGLLPTVKTEAYFDIKLLDGMDKEGYQNFINSNSERFTDGFIMLWDFNSNDIDITHGDHLGCEMIAISR